MFCASGGRCSVDYIEAIGGSSELIIVLNKVGAVASSETLGQAHCESVNTAIDGLAFQQIYHQILPYRHEAGISVTTSSVAYFSTAQNEYVVI